VRLKPRLRQLLTAALLIWTLTNSALAGFSPGLDQLGSAYDQGQAITLDIRAALESWNALSPDSLAAVQDALKGTVLQLQAQEKDEQGVSSVSLTLDSKTLFQVNESWNAQQRLMELLPQGLRYLSDPAQVPLDLLMDAEGGVPWENLLRAETWQALQGVLPQVYALLEPFQQTVKVSTSIKNVGTARTRLEYALTQEEWAAQWPQIAQLFSGALTPWLGETLSQALMAVRFEDEGTFKRFADDVGMDMGWQFTGKLSLGEEDTRRVTLFVGFEANKGMYISLKLPAVKGRNDLTFNFSARQSSGDGKRSLQADCVFTSRKDEDKLSAKGLIKLESADSPEGERIRGSIRLDSLLTPGQTQRQRLTLNPELLYKDGRLSGTLAVSQEQGSAANLALDLSLLLNAGKMIMPPAEAGAKDLRGMAQSALQAEQGSFLQALLEPLKGFLLQLPQKQRAQLLHDMGRIQRTQGDSVPPLPEADPESFVVSDISVEEENP